MDELRQAEDARIRTSSDGAVDRAGRAGLRRALLLSALVVVLFGFAGLVWYAYEQYRGASQDGEPPLIRADAEPARVRPEDPGGLDVPHRDRLVLQERGEPAGESGDEAVLPPPEEPMPRPAPMLERPIASTDVPVFAVRPGAGRPEAPEMAEALDAEGAEALIARDEAQPPDLITAPQFQAAAPAPTAPAAQDVVVGIIGGPMRTLPVAPPIHLDRAVALGGQPDGVAGRIEIAEGALGLVRRRPPSAPTSARPPQAPEPAQVPQTAAAPQVTATVAVAPPAEPAPDGDTDAPPVEAVAAAASPPAPPEPQPQPAAERTYRVQLAAVNTDEAARTGWDGFKQRYPDLLGGLDLYIQVVEVNGRTYHRIQGGMLDGDGAGTLCQQLRDRGTDCIVRP